MDNNADNNAAMQTMDGDADDDYAAADDNTDDNAAMQTMMQLTLTQTTMQ
jgi:hypothetical protein